MEESLGKGAPSNTMRGFQAGTSTWRSPLPSMTTPSLADLVWVILACLPPLCTSASLVEVVFLSSITSFPFWSCFLFLSAWSGWEVWVEGRVGGLDWTAFSVTLPPVWDSSRSRRLVLILRYNPIASGIKGSFCVWFTYARGRWLKSPMEASREWSQLKISKSSQSQKLQQLLLLLPLLILLLWWLAGKELLLPRPCTGGMALLLIRLLVPDLS